MPLVAFLVVNLCNQIRHFLDRDSLRIRIKLSKIQLFLDLLLVSRRNQILFSPVRHLHLCLVIRSLATKECRPVFSELLPISLEHKVL